ncbi:hypothetical protein [Clostridium sp. BSD9I1]|uniref:hypothetical protein n=1 Tax=Clostridium sp. BSD9I1 TaxID=2003589 RepID=UPI001644BC76|nr:hypothetical protein [Clostridium sp. BSD9I1]
MNTNDIKITVEYKNDEEQRNKFVKYIIHLILENNYILGDPYVNDFKKDSEEGDSSYD